MFVVNLVISRFGIDPDTDVADLGLILVVIFMIGRGFGMYCGGGFGDFGDLGLNLVVLLMIWAIRGRSWL